MPLGDAWAKGERNGSAAAAGAAGGMKVSLRDGDEKKNQRGFKAIPMAGIRKRGEESVRLRKEMRDSTVQKRRQITEGRYTAGSGIDVEMSNSSATAMTDNAVTPLPPPAQPAPSGGRGSSSALTLVRKDPTWVPEIKVRPGPTHLVNVELCQEVANRVKVTVDAQPTPKTNGQLAQLSLPKLALQLNGNDQKAQLAAATELRKMLSLQYDPPIQEVIECSFIPRLVHLIRLSWQTSNDKLSQDIQYECLWACTNVASGDSAQTRHCIENNMVETAIESLKSPSETIRSQSIWLLANMAGEAGVMRDIIVEQTPAIEYILKGCQFSKEVDTFRMVAWIFSLFSRQFKTSSKNQSGQPKWERAKLMLPALHNLISMDDSETVVEACWAFSSLTEDPTDNNEHLDDILKVLPGLCKKLVHILETGLNKPRHRVPALRTLGHILSGNHDHTEAVLQANVMPILSTLLKDPLPEIQKEVCWSISNIASQSVKPVIEAKLIPPLIFLMKSGSNIDFAIRKEVTWAITNSIDSADTQQLQYMVGQGVISALCANLKIDEVHVLLKSLEALRTVLRADKHNTLPDTILPPGNSGPPGKPYADLVEECDGLRFLEALLENENEDVYELTSKIIAEFFKPDDFDDEDANPPNHPWKIQ